MAILLIILKLLFQRNSYINILPNTANPKQKQIWKQENKTGFYKFCCSCCCLFKKKPESLSLSKGNNFGNTQMFKTEKTPISTAKPKTTGLKKNNGWKMTVLNHDLSTYFYFSGWGSFGSLIRVMKKIMG